MDKTKMENVTNNLLNLIFHINNKLFNHSEIVKNNTIPPSHMKVLFHLLNIKSTSVSNVAKCLDISKPNMTPIIDKLISEGFVHRYTDPKDRRKFKIELTDKAYKFLEEKKIEMKNNLSERISSLEEDDLINIDYHINEMSKIIKKIK